MTRSHGNTRIPSPYFPNLKLKVEVQQALDNAWKFDIVKCSISVAREASPQLVGAPGASLTPDELKYLKSLKLSKIQTQRKEVEGDSAVLQQIFTCRNHSLEDDLPSGLDEATLEKELDDFYDANDVTTQPLESSMLDQVLDDFYGAGDFATRPLDRHEVDEGFCDSPNRSSGISTTWITLPEKNGVVSGQASTNNRSFQDSGIQMDDAFAEASLSESSHGFTTSITKGNEKEGMIEGSASCLTFNVNHATPAGKRATAPWPHCLDSNYEYYWRSGREAPYGLEGLLSPGCDRDEGLNGFKSMRDINVTAPLDTMIPDTRASSPELPILDKALTTTISAVQNPAPVSATAEPGCPSSFVADAQLPPVVEPTELQSEANTFQENEAHREVPDYPFQSRHKYVLNGFHGMEPYQVHSAAVATQLHHPAPRTPFKHKILPEYNSDSVDNDEASGVNNYRAKSHGFNDSTSSLDVSVPESPVNETSQQLAFNRYIQGTSAPSTLARQSTSTASINGSSASQPENWALTPQVEALGNPETAGSALQADAASNPVDAILTTALDAATNAALTPVPDTPPFSPLTPKHKPGKVFEITAQPSGSTNDIHKAPNVFTFAMPSECPTHSAIITSGPLDEATATTLPSPQPQQFSDPPYQLPSLLDTSPNGSLVTPSRQLTRVDIDATASTPTKPLSTPSECLGQFHITSPQRFMPTTAPVSPTPAPRPRNQHHGMIALRAVGSPAEAMKLEKGYKNVFSSPQLGGRGYGGTGDFAESGEMGDQELTEPSSDVAVANEVDEAEARALAAAKKPKGIGALRQNAQRQAAHNEPAKESTEEAVLVPTQDQRIEGQQKGASEAVVVPSKNKQAEEQKKGTKEPAKKKARRSAQKESFS